MLLRPLRALAPVLVTALLAACGASDDEGSAAVEQAALALTLAGPDLVHVGEEIALHVGGAPGATFEAVDVPAGLRVRFEGTKVLVAADPGARLGDGQLTIRARSREATSEARAPLFVAGVPGSLDETFGQGGVVAGPPTSGAMGFDLDRAGNVIVSGYDSASARAMVARFLPNGQPDASFDDDGVALVRPATLDHYSGVGVRVLPSGRVLVGGSGAKGQSFPPTWSCVMALGVDGRVDGAFGQGGVACVGADTGMHSAVGFDVAADGSSFLFGSMDDKARDPFVAKLDPTGKPDGAYGSGGVARLSRPGMQNPFRFAVDGEGGAVFTVVETDAQMKLSGSYAMRLDPRGLPDPWFGVRFLKRGDAWITGRSLAFGPDGQLFVGGSTILNGTEEAGGAITAMSAKGELLPSFGEQGTVATAEGVSALHHDGASLLVAELGSFKAPRASMLRLSSDAQPDARWSRSSYAVEQMPLAVRTAGRAQAYVLTTALYPKQGFSLLRVWR